MLQSFQNHKIERICKLLPLLVLIIILGMGLIGCSKNKGKDKVSEDTSSLSQEETKIGIVSEGKAASVYIDAKGKDYEGMHLVAKSFAEDINMVTGVTPDIVTDMDQLEGTVIIAGSIGNNEIIDTLIANDVINISAIKNKWETYQIQVVEAPVEGVAQAIVIVGSDKRGTFYGIYRISELIGVSPWVFWGDVLPKKQSQLLFSENELQITSKEPSVKYRGIFLNDEWPSLGNWVSKRYGGFNERFYEEVFELILRLKGNYLWPAMWSSSFSGDGVSSSVANAKLADIYGIVMGTSHHEPMFRAGVEWQKIYRNYGTSNLWDFAGNEEAITKFWEDGLQRNKDFESLITLGMRGEADSALQGTDQENIELLKSIITTQKELLKKYNLEDAPQVLTLYKEVEKFWYGTNGTQGLRDWEALDDVTIMLAEDNFGNVRTLPAADEKNRAAGWGMYYHFDYHGGPRSYEWVNTIPIEKVWEQMSMAYDYGVKEVWVVNVGDLKPMEFPISYFLDLAYDFEAWGTDGINKTAEYTRQWVEQQYGHVVNEEAVEGITEVLSDYTRMNGKRKPEITYASTYSFTNYNEAQRVLAEAIDLENRARKYYDMMPEDYKDSYYQLVYYPAAASANVTKMQIFAGLNQLYHSRKSVLANTYAALAQETIAADTQMQSYYNNKMSGGKWSGMMSSPHIGYTKWNSDDWTYPELRYVTPAEDYVMIVDVEGTETAYLSGVGALPAFTNLQRECYHITISNGGGIGFDYSISTSADWIRVDKTQGRIYTGDTVQVSVDWDKVIKTSEGEIIITGGEDEVKIRVIAEVMDVKDLSDMTFVETHDVISMEAQHTSNRVAKSNVQWNVIENYGRTLSSVKMFPTTISFAKPEEAPYLEYKVYVREDTEYTLTAYIAPTNNLSEDSRLRYGVSFDGGSIVAADALLPDFIAGENSNRAWSNAVMANIHTMTTTHSLTKGMHTLRFYGMDAGLVLQKLVLSKGALPSSYFGPEESYYIGKEIRQQEGSRYSVNTEYTLPGTMLVEDLKRKDKNIADTVNVSAPGEYQITLQGEVRNAAGIEVKIGDQVVSTLQWDTGEAEVSSDWFTLKQGRHELTIAILSGDADIRTVKFHAYNPETVYPVTITASSTAGGYDVNNVYDKRRETTWKPEEDDTKPWVEFAFGRVYYLDHFVLRGSLEGIRNYEIQTSIRGGQWRTVYKGTEPETGQEIYLQGEDAISGDKLRIVFTELTDEIAVSDMILNPYINWSIEDGNTAVEITKESDIDKYTIIDGDRINPGWITTGNQTVTLTFSEARTMDTVTVVGIQSTVKDGKEGVIPDMNMTSPYVQRQYTISYLDNSGKWVETADYITAPDGAETEPLRKVINKISLRDTITTTSIRVAIGTSHWIRLIELEAVEHHKISTGEK